MIANRKQLNEILVNEIPMASVKQLIDKFLLKIQFDENDAYPRDIDDLALQLYVTSLLKHDDFTFIKLDFYFDSDVYEQEFLDVLVKSATKFDFDKIVESNRKFPKLNGKIVKCELIKRNDKILVRGLNEEVFLKLYFSSAEYGGGPIRLISNIKLQDEAMFVIEFEEEKCVENLLNRKHQNNIRVRPFYDDIEYLRNIKRKRPKVKNVQHSFSSIEFPYNLFIKNEYFQKDFESYLKSKELKLLEIKDREFQIEYETPTISIDIVNRVLKEFEKRFTFYEWIIDADVFGKIEMKIITLYSNMKNINLTLDSKHNNTDKGFIRIEGYIEIIDSERNKIECIVNDDENRRMSDQIDKLRQYECDLLLKYDFIKQSKSLYSDVIIKIIPSKGTVSFTGMYRSVARSKEKMFDMLRTVKEKHYHISFNIGRFLNESKDFIEKCFEMNKILCEYTIKAQDSKGNQMTFTNDEFLVNMKPLLILYAIDETHIFKAYEYIEENIDEFSLDLKSEYIELLGTLFPQFLERVQKELAISQESDHVRFLISKDRSRVSCVGEKYVVKRLSESIVDFFEANATIVDSCDELSNENLRYLKIVKEGDISNFCKKLSRDLDTEVSANFEVINRDYKNIQLKLHGTKRSNERVMLKLKEYLANKISEDLELDAHLADMFTSEKTLKRLNFIEKETGCLIINKIVEKQAGYNNEFNNKTFKTKLNDKSKNSVIFQQNLSDIGVRIFVVNDSITNFGPVNVIVNALDTDLKPVVSETNAFLEIYEKAGAQLRKELNDIKRRENTIYENEFFQTTAAGLVNCKSIIHLIIPKKLESKRDYKNLKECILNTLRMADKSRFKSIAYPLFYNVGLVNELVSLIFETLNEYMLEARLSSSIEEIYFVDRDSKCAKKFETALKEKLTAQTEKITETNGNHAGKSAPIKLEIGSIIDEKFAVDAIVNTTSSDLVLTNGTVSKIILQKAGDEIQQELKTKYPKGLQDLFVAVSSAGKMKPIKHIFHVSLNDYSPDKQVETAFKNRINELLKQADLNNCASIAMPALGTGILKYPKDKVAKWMYTSINQYFDTKKDTGLNRVLIVLFDKDTQTIKEFQDYEKKQHQQEQSFGFFEKIGNFVSKHIGEIGVKYTPVKESRITSAGGGVLGDENIGFKMKLDKNLTFHVYVGDIVQSKEDVIINPTDAAFGLNGNVAKVLMAAAGDKLRAELNDSRIMDHTGVFWSNAGNLNAKKILHLDVQNNDINACMVNSLIHLNEKKYQSVVYPVIGTGTQQVSAKSAVKQMLEGINIFLTEILGKNTLHVRDIKVCIYQKQEQILKIFYDEMKEFDAAKRQEKRASYQDDYLDDFTVAGAYDEEMNQTDKVLLKLVSDKKDSIVDAKAQILEITEEDTVRQPVHNQQIEHLTTQQIDQLDKICKEYNTKFDILKAARTIKVQGRIADVTKCVTIINEWLREYEVKIMQNAADIYKIVQWEYTIDNKLWQSFNMFINQKIENAYENRLQIVEFDSENDERLLVDIKNLLLYRDALKNPIGKVKRVDLKKDNTFGIEMPNNWDKTKLYDLVALAADSQEYKNVIATFEKHGLRGRINNIISIERVQNSRLFIQYMAHKKYFEDRDKNNVNERTLFHGTTGATVENIWKFGFNRSFAGKNATGMMMNLRKNSS